MVCYLDTSAWIAWKFQQKGEEIFGSVSLEKDTLVSTPLLAAEYVAFLRRIDQLTSTRFEDDLAFVSWFNPSEPLFREYLSCLKGRNLRGADLYHLASALWFAEGHGPEIRFLTCDTEQKAVSKTLGFQV